MGPSVFSLVRVSEVGSLFVVVIVFYMKIRGLYHSLLETTKVGGRHRPTVPSGSLSCVRLVTLRVPSSLRP